MGIISESLDNFEECIKLILQNSLSKSILAIILIDSLVDIYLYNYLQNIIAENECCLEMYKNFNYLHTTSGFDEKIEKLSNKGKRLSAIINRFEEKIKWLETEGIIAQEVSISLQALHENRNQYLHRGKIKKRDAILYAKLYLYLFQQLFISIPINSASSSDFEDTIVQETFSNNHIDFFKQNSRAALVERLNLKYNVYFDPHNFINDLHKFLLQEYNNLLDALCFIVETMADKESIIRLLESEYKAGTIKILQSKSGSNQIALESTKMQNILGDIRKLIISENEHVALSRFNQIYSRIQTLALPVLKLEGDIDLEIQLQVDILRGK